MKEIAGKKGKVLLYASFDELKKHFDKAIQEACGKLMMFIPISLYDTVKSTSKNLVALRTCWQVHFC